MAWALRAVTRKCTGDWIRDASGAVLTFATAADAHETFAARERDCRERGYEMGLVPYSEEREGSP